MAARVEIVGLNNLISTMRKAGADLSDLKAANQKAGQIVADAAKGVVPTRTGRLQGSIRSARQAKAAVVKAGGSGIRYARFAEFGSAKIRAYHYIYGSAERTQPEWLDAYEQEVQKIIFSINGQ